MNDKLTTLTMKLISGYTVRDIQAMLRNGNYITGIDENIQAVRLIGLHVRNRKSGGRYLQGLTMGGKTVSIRDAYPS